jgi:hypothetical protein
MGAPHCQRRVARCPSDFSAEIGPVGDSYCYQGWRDRSCRFRAGMHGRPAGGIPVLTARSGSPSGRRAGRMAGIEVGFAFRIKPSSRAALHRTKPLAFKPIGYMGPFLKPARQPAGHRCRDRGSFSPPFLFESSTHPTKPHPIERDPVSRLLQRWTLPTLTWRRP